MYPKIVTVNVFELGMGTRLGVVLGRHQGTLQRAVRVRLRTAGCFQLTLLTGFRLIREPLPVEAAIALLLWCAELCGAGPGRRSPQQEPSRVSTWLS